MFLSGLTKLKRRRSRQSSREQQLSAQLDRLQAESTATNASLLQHFSLLAKAQDTLQGTCVCYDAPGMQRGFTSQHSSSCIKELNADDDTIVAHKHAPTRAKRRVRRNELFYLRVSFTAWLTGRIWDFAATQSQGSRTFNITSWNTVPCNSQIFDHCWRGDTEAVKRLIAQGDASLTDVNYKGSSLLHVRCAPNMPAWLTLRVKSSMLYLDNKLIYVVSCSNSRVFVIARQ